VLRPCLGLHAVVSATLVRRLLRTTSQRRHRRANDARYGRGATPAWARAARHCQHGIAAPPRPTGSAPRRRRAVEIRWPPAERKNDRHWGEKMTATGRNRWPLTVGAVSRRGGVQIHGMEIRCVGETRQVSLLRRALRSTSLTSTRSTAASESCHCAGSVVLPSDHTRRCEHILDFRPRMRAESVVPQAERPRSGIGRGGDQKVGLVLIPQPRLRSVDALAVVGARCPGR
jgi:hypothetical protein